MLDLILELGFNWPWIEMVGPWSELVGPWVESWLGGPPIIFYLI